jgi:hypothetical protein
MKNFKTYLKTFGTGLMFAMSADGYRRTVFNDNKSKETERVIQETVRRSTELSNKLNDQIEQNVINNTEIESSLNKIKTGLEIIQQKVEVLNTIATQESNKTGGNLSSDVLTTSVKQSAVGIDSINDSLKEEAVKVNSIIDKVLEFINSSNNNSNFGVQTFQDLLDQYYQFFDSLTIIQKGAFAHTLLCICILLCIFDILLAYYSDKLILYLNLENKYPRLSKYVKLRRKLQNYYIKLNFILIIIVVLFALYCNISILSYTIK